MNQSILPLVAVAILFAAAAHAQPTAPNLQDIKQLIKDKQFPQALQRITAALSAPMAANKYDLYMLKGDCHLQTKSSAMASDAFTRALKETQDLEPRAVAQAHVTLIKKSPGLLYKAKTGEVKNQTFDITAPDTRKQAFAALLADELMTNKAKIKQAEGAKKLPPIMDIVDDVIMLEGMEIAAKGKPEETGEILKSIMGRAKDLISDALKEMERDVNRIDKAANTYREFTQEEIDARLRVRRVTVWQKMGLTRDDTNQLHDIGATCDKIDPAIQILTQGISSAQKELDSFTDQALKIRKQIANILAQDYTQIYHTKPKP